MLPQDRPCSLHPGAAGAVLRVSPAWRWKTVMALAIQKGERFRTGEGGRPQETRPGCSPLGSVPKKAPSVRPSADRADLVADERVVRERTAVDRLRGPGRAVFHGLAEKLPGNLKSPRLEPCQRTLAARCSRPGLQGGESGRKRRQVERLRCRSAIRARTPASLPKRAIRCSGFGPSRRVPLRLDEIDEELGGGGCCRCQQDLGKPPAGAALGDRPDRLAADDGVLVEMVSRALSGSCGQDAYLQEGVFARRSARVATVDS